MLSYIPPKIKTLPTQSDPKAPRYWLYHNPIKHREYQNNYPDLHETIGSK